MSKKTEKSRGTTRTIKKIATMFVIIAILLAGAEGVLRLLGYPSSYSALFTFDNEMGYRYASGPHSFYSGNKKYSVLIDRYGILDHVGRGRADVLILGDGVIAGLELPVEERLASRVYNSTKLKTLNLAVPGYGTLQQWMAMRNWIDGNGAPDHVFIVYNFSNASFENVSGWENLRVPEVRTEGTMLSVVPPDFPSEAWQTLRKVIWNSRLAGVFCQLRSEYFPAVPSIGEQQKLLYSTESTPESQAADETTRFAVKKIMELRDQYGFNLTWLGWHDIGLERRAGLTAEMAQVAEQRVEALTGEESNWKHIFNELPQSPEEIESWEKAWLHPGSNHASSNAIARLAARIAVAVHFELEAGQD